MSDELLPLEGSPEMHRQPLVPDAAASEQAPATLLTPGLLGEIQAMLDASVARADEALALIRAAAGPQPGKIPQDMLTSINMGTGYMRASRDTIARLFKEWQGVVRQQTCAHDRGLVHKPRRSFCKLCDLEFTHDRVKNCWVPMEFSR
jgi:hypothetical protein